jgi:hypothetical protein
VRTLVGERARAHHTRRLHSVPLAAMGVMFVSALVIDFADGVEVG